LVLTCWVLATGALLSGCGPEEVTEVDKDSISVTLNGYLKLLSEAYSTGNVEVLKEYAAEKEVARVYTRVSELADEGKYVDATFYQMTLEEVVIWSHANAYATTVEVWDLRVRTNGSEVLLGEETNQASRVKYQLKLRDGTWQVLHRELDQTL